MKAIQKTKNGVKVVEVPTPTPKQGEVLISVVVAGYCRTDGYVARGIIETRTPLILGHEFSGVVEQVGQNVSRCAPGDRVAVMPILKEDEHYVGKMVGVDMDGAFADFVVVPEELVYPISDKLSFVHAAYAEPVAASLAVTQVGNPKESVGVVVGENRIASLTCHLMESGGFKNVKNISLEELKKVPDRTFDFVVETFIDPDLITEITRTLKIGGTCVLKSRKLEEVPINVGELVRKEIVVKGLYYGDFQEALNLLTEGNVFVDDFLGDVISFEEAIEVLTSTTNEDKKIFFTNKKEFLTRE